MRIIKNVHGKNYKRKKIMKEYIGTEFYWKLKNVTNQNETITKKILYENYLEIFSKHRKKKVIENTLSLLLTNLFIIGEKELFSDTDKRRWVFENWDSYEKIRMTGLLLNFSKSHTKNDFYWYGDVKVFHRTLANVLSEIEQEGYCVRRDGYYCKNKGYNSKFEIGYWLFNWKKLYDIYIQYDDLDIQIEDNYSPVVIKRKIDGNYKNCTNEYNIDLLLKEDIEYINKLRSMYSEMNVSLDLQNSNNVQNQIFEDYLNQKRYEYENKDESNVFQYDVYTEIELLNKRLSKPVYPYRLYHDDGNFCWGRVYGNGIDSLPKMYKDSILKINGDYTVSIDVKSSILQFYILTYHEDIDNKQDFYSYDSLQNVIDREHRKLYSQCLNYNSSIINAFRAYNGHMLLKQDYNSVITMELFKSIYQNMIEERPYFQGIWLHPEMSKSIILHEADFMKTVSQEMMNQHIPHLCNFDAIYTSYKNLSTTIEIFCSLSLSKFNRSIHIDYDNELYSSLI